MMRIFVYRIYLQQDIWEIDNTVVEVDVLEEKSSSKVLSSYTCTLHTILNEYGFGLSNRKTAKDFTAIDWGRVKYLYLRKTFVWYNIGEMVSSSLSLHEACDIIYKGFVQNSTVTCIINEMMEDRENGGYPSLCITQTWIKLNVPYNKTYKNIFVGVDVS